MTTTNTIRHTLTIGALSLILAACAAEEAASETEEEASTDTGASDNTLSEESMEMAETAWLSVTADGEVFTTYLDGDGRYRDVSGGTLRFGGTWEQTPDRELCFTPDEGEGACWEHRSPGLNGTMRATATDGRAIEVKKVSYTPPTPDQEAAVKDAEPTGGERVRG